MLLASGTSGLASSASNIEVVGTTLTFGGLVGNYINEVGSLNKSGNGILVLSGTSTYSGATSVSGGTLDLQGTLNNTSPTANNAVADIGTTLTIQGKGARSITTTPTAMPRRHRPDLLSEYGRAHAQWRR